ncbi:hypothetical protein BDP27DRAFT_1431428 [Rhodocollybia butyracea]|uniref:DUF6532 domain-containing protein n=1 Tax=Rhodocollybia butyracea TaxID=206335 RepID=A0A9P5TYM8_9AGAR|nr:hypothetical protein BDP27DRAFT_1431428 [Rhodocollybia butyracea]
MDASSSQSDEERSSSSRNSNRITIAAPKPRRLSITPPVLYNAIPYVPTKAKNSVRQWRETVPKAPSVQQSMLDEQYSQGMTKSPHHVPVFQQEYTPVSVTTLTPGYTSRMRQSPTAEAVSLTLRGPRPLPVTKSRSPQSVMNIDNELPKLPAPFTPQYEPSQLAVNWLLEKRRYHHGEVDLTAKTADNTPFRSPLFDKLLHARLEREQCIPVLLIAMCAVLIGHVLEEWAAGYKVESDFSNEHLASQTAEPEVVPAQTYDYDKLNAYARGSQAAAAETSACGNNDGKTAENGDSKADGDVDVERSEGSSKIDDDINNAIVADREFPTLDSKDHKTISESGLFNVVAHKCHPSVNL